MITITATTPVGEPPRWALLQRELFARLDEAWREFEARFCEPDGRLRYSGRMYGRDGVDDFYEPFFNWPTLYRLGGSSDALASAKLHWEGVTRQLAEFGFVHDEYELGYDWFHQAESLPLFVNLCAADPRDDAFRGRARRFADHYLPGSANYDSTTRSIVAPHTGSGGPRWGVGEDWTEYSADQAGMEVYGLPLLDVPGIRTWDDLRVPGAARRMGDAMQSRMGRGDTVVNLAATTLATNAWLYDHEDRYADWVLEYVDAWRDRARVNGGIVPDNVGSRGSVGEDHGGAWFGGHYGWTWPHGLHSILPAITVAGLNAMLLTGSTARLDLARGTLDAVLALARVESDLVHQGSLGGEWAEKFDATAETPELLVPYRHGPDGWFDWHPVPLAYPLWLSWASGETADERRLERLREESPRDWRTVHEFRDKEEQGHEAPWIAYLAGDNPDYPEAALELALRQVEGRLTLIAQSPAEPEDGDIHFWQKRNPVVVEVLSQLTTGAPPAVYYGGLGLARIVFGDASAGRPGLPEGVAALVTEENAAGVSVELVNTSGVRHTVTVQAGAFGEDSVREVLAAGAAHAVAASRFLVELPPLTRTTLALRIDRRTRRPSHQTFEPNHQENP